MTAVIEQEAPALEAVPVESPPFIEATPVTLEPSASSSDALLGMATLGKTAAALALILVIIFIVAMAVRRWGPLKNQRGRHIKVVGSTPVGPKESVVIVEVEDTWLVLGVGSGNVNKLHELPAAPGAEKSEPRVGAGFESGDSFGTRFSKALKHNAGLSKQS